MVVSPLIDVPVTTSQEDLALRAKAIRENYGPESFILFYLLIRDEEMAPQVVKEWAPRVFANEAAGRKTMLMAARGITKTTFGIMLAADKIGHQPTVRAYLVFVY